MKSRVTGSPAAVAVRNRPAAAADGCWSDAASPKLEDLDACYSGPFPIAGDPRIATQSPSDEWIIAFVAPAGDVGRYSSLARNPVTGKLRRFVPL